MINLIIGRVDLGKFSYDSDYELIVDNGLEYRIHGLKEGVETLVCALEDGWANECHMHGAQEYLFDASCAQPYGEAAH